MGQRYRFSFNENGDVLDPSSWIEDNNELAAEFNGYLDRDNFGRGDIVQAEIVANAFTKVEGFASTSIYTPERTNVSWQGGAGNDAAGIYSKEITATVDCGLCVEVNLTWVWVKLTTQYSVSGSGPVGNPAGTPPNPIPLSTFAVDTVQFRITVDGVAIGQSGLFEDMHHNYGTYLLGATVLTSGVHTVRVECCVARRRWEGLGQDGICTYAVNISNRNLVVTQERR